MVWSVGQWIKNQIDNEYSENENAKMYRVIQEDRIRNKSIL